MKTISFINFKGGCGKTTSAVNFAYILTAVHKKRVLLIDNDDQGNASRFYKLYGKCSFTISNLLLGEIEDISQAIGTCMFNCGEKNAIDIDVISADLTLAQVDGDFKNPFALRDALQTVAEDYDYCIIDNAPSKNNSVAIALIATDDVMIPIKMDRYILDGLTVLDTLINQTKAVNPNINVAGCFVTEYQRNKLCKQAKAVVEKESNYHVFDTVIRKTVRVQETTFAHQPLLAYAPKATATQDYLSLVEEYLAQEKGC